MQKLMRHKIKIAILLAAVAAVGAGLFFSGVLKKKEPVKTKYPVAPISLVQPFVINLADEDENHYVKLAIAVRLEPMTTIEHHLFTTPPGGGGHGGGGDAETGPIKVSKHPPFRDAVIVTVSKFTSDDLLSSDGKEELKKALIEEFEKVAAQDELPPPRKSEEVDETAHSPADPPYHVVDVYFEEFAVQ